MYKWKCTILDDHNGDLSEDQLMRLGGFVQTGLEDQKPSTTGG